MKQEVIKIIAGVANVPARKIKLESNLVSDLNIDSLDLVELISAFEDKYHVTIDDNDIKDFQTVGDIINYIESHVEDLH